MSLNEDYYERKIDWDSHYESPEESYEPEEEQEEPAPIQLPPLEEGDEECPF